MMDAQILHAHFNWRRGKNEKIVVTKQIFFLPFKITLFLFKFWEKVILSFHLFIVCFVKVNLSESIRLMWFFVLFNGLLVFISCYFGPLYVCNMYILDVAFASPFLVYSNLFIYSFADLFVCDKSHFAYNFAFKWIWYFIEYYVDLFKFQMGFYARHHFQCYQNISRMCFLFRWNFSYIAFYLL